MQVAIFLVLYRKVSFEESLSLLRINYLFNNYILIKLNNLNK